MMKEILNSSKRRCIQVKSVLCILILFAAFPAIQAQENRMTPVDYVNPFIDTHKSRWFYFSSASRPFGMVCLSPDTHTVGSWNSGYMYDSLHVRCFSHIHAWQMSGVAVMPTTGEFKGHKGMNVYRSAFSHDGEIAKPGYHKIFLDDYGCDKNKNDPEKNIYIRKATLNGKPLNKLN